MAVPGQSSLFNVFNEMVTTTFRNHRKEVVDAVTNHNALYRRLVSRGNLRKEDGGLSIVTPLEFAENSTYQRYSGYDRLNVQAVEVLTAAEYPWRQVAVNLAASGEELRKNSGKSRIINFAKTKLKNAKKSMANGLSQDFYSDGSLTNQVNGIQALISDSGTGTVGGISSGTYSFWANIVQSAASPLQGGGGITPGATTIESLMLPLWLRTTRGADNVDLIVMSEDYFTYYEQSQTSLKRYAPDDNGQGGMVSMKYKTADVFFDSAVSGVPTSHAYFMNTDYIEVVSHKDADMTVMDELQSVNQDATVTPILWMGNLTCSHRALQGVMKA